jgi:hypothetical protein
MAGSGPAMTIIGQELNGPDEAADCAGLDKRLK